jgi:hypothetical protein
MDGADDDDGGTDYDLLLQPFLAPTATTTAVPTGATTAIYQRPNRCLLRELLLASLSSKTPLIFQISGPYALDVLFNRAAMTPLGDSILFLNGDHYCHDFPLYLNHREQQQQSHQLQQATTNHLPPPPHQQYQYSKRSLQRLQIVRVATPHELARHILSIHTTTTNNNHDTNDDDDDDDGSNNNNNNWNGRNGNSSSNIGFIGMALSETFWQIDFTARNIICTCGG